MIKFLKFIGWTIYLILLFVSGILIGGFLIPYIVIKRHKQNKLKRLDTQSLTRIANSLEVVNGK